VKRAAGLLFNEGFLLQACTALIVVCSAVALHGSWHWSLVGDDALMCYVVLLMEKGREPYSQLKDIDVPRSYFFEYLSMKAFGWGSFGLRVYSSRPSDLLFTSARSFGQRWSDYAFCAGIDPCALVSSLCA
jgi:hypothetical protein